jgi:hypothetical protein
VFFCVGQAPLSQKICGELDKRGLSHVGDVVRTAATEIKKAAGGEPTAGTKQY